MYGMIALRTKTVAHNLASIVRQCEWPSLPRKVLEIQNFCYHGNLLGTMKKGLTLVPRRIPLHMGALILVIQQ